MRKGNTRDTPAAELAERASALLAATAVLALLLLSTLLPAEGKRLMANLTAPVGIASANTSEAPLPDTEPSLADVDADIPSAVYARLLKITAEVLDKPSSLILGEDGPQILIYHTHDTEAYTQTAGHEYVPSGDWRTEDASCSVIAVGEELARILNEDYGIETIHDTTRHEPPLITTAYTRSLETMLAYKQKYPSLKCSSIFTATESDLRGMRTITSLSTAFGAQGSCSSSARAGTPPARRRTQSPISSPTTRWRWASRKGF